MRLARFPIKGLACVSAMLVACMPMAAAAADGDSPVLFLNPAKRDARPAGAPPASIRFITVDGFAPFSSFDATGQVRGIHVDLARAICFELEIVQSCTIQVVAFKDVEDIIESGQADAALAGLVPDADSRARLLFSEPYARLPARFVANPASKSSEQGVVAGSVHARMAAVLFPDRTFKTYPDQVAMLDDLKTGAINSAFGDGMALGLWAASAAASACCTLQPGGYFLPSLRPDALRIAFSTSRPELQDAVNGAMRDIQISGRLEEIMLRNLPFDLTR
jgi:polar amino acid transport system substrate-binding protein